jgi:penicillin-binding protein 2
MLKYKYRHRFTFVTISLTLIFIAIGLQLVNLQIVNGESYEEESQHKLLKNRRIIASRGKILDASGTPLAYNRISYSVEITKTSISNDGLNKMLLKLVNIFEKNNDSYNDNLSNYLEFDPMEFGAYLNTDSSLKRWKNDIVNDDEDLTKLANAKKVFNYLRKEKFAIDDKYSDEEAYKIMTLRYEILINGYTILDALNLANDVSIKSISEIEEQNHHLPGIATNIEPMRKYADIESIAHIIGYTSNISSEEYEELKDDGYYLTDYIGKMGIEKYCEDDLRGTDGTKSVEVDIWGKQFNEINSEDAVSGKNLTLTIDMDLQNIAYDSLKNTIKDIRTSSQGGSANYNDAYFGSVVALDVSSGAVLAMASFPSYDPSIFLEDSSNKEAQKEIASLYDPENKVTSQYNRAISGTYPPGSTFKPLVGLTALEEGIITKNTIINDPGYMYVEGVKLTCLEWRNGQGAHGNQTLKDGLRTSCNMFFYNLGIMTGINKITSWASKFGLGEKTGIELTGEREGIIASPEYHETLDLDYKFGKVMTAHASIGQSYNLYTPLQLASYVSTLASDGKKYNVHLIKSKSDASGENVEETKIEYEDLKINSESLEAVKEGMLAVTSSGTASGYFNDLTYDVAAKTGTAQTYEQNHSDNGVFIAYAPADDPKIAVAIVVERGVYGAYTAPIARDIFEAYIGK